MLSPPTVRAISVAADINSNVFYLYFLVWSLSRLLCCVGSGLNVARGLSIHGHRFYLLCPDVLSLVGELLSGDEFGSSNILQF
jgi:hypothetical protein